jgi:copper chaperone CopZ
MPCIMRETIQLDQIRCERCVSRLASAIAPLKGLHDARVEMGTSSVVVDYDAELRPSLDEALVGAGFRIVERRELADLASG